MPMLASLLLAATSYALPAQGTWAGHHVTLGRRDVPFLGRRETRTDAWVLARLRSRADGSIEIAQETCRVAFGRVAGVQVSMDGHALPSSTLKLFEDDGALGGRSVVAWDEDDVDDDGHPGMTVRVRARVCSGELYVANRSDTRARARVVDGRIYGTTSVHVVQTVLGARGACLSVVASDTDERQRGTFAFAPVDAGETCESLTKNGWPIAAP
jgi:hypothetical protein